MIKKFNLLIITCFAFNLCACQETTSSQGVTSSENVNLLTQNVKLSAFNKSYIEGATISLYKNDDLVSSARTDSNGNAAIKVPEYDTYKVSIEYKPGFILDSEYYTSTSGEELQVNCVTSIIEEEMPENLSFYKLGNVIYDFSFTECENNNENTLSNLLKDKKVLIVNFFYTTCKYCLLEFPHMEEGYQKYKDDVEILAISDRDSLSAIKKLKYDEMLSFNMTTNAFLTFFFPVSKFPTTFIIDRYGVMSKIDTNYLQSVEDFDNLVTPYLDDNYTPTITDYNYF